MADDRPITVQELIHQLTEDYVDQSMKLEVYLPGQEGSPRTAYVSGVTRHAFTLELDWVAERHG